jgi:hypothetical protein
MKTTLLAITVTSFSLFACAAHNDESGSSSADVTGSAEATEGAACGTGVSGITINCGGGLRCDVDPKSHGADQMGTCVRAKPGELGGTCGTGITGITVDCATGLSCEVDAKVGAGDQTGTCISKW